MENERVNSTLGDEKLNENMEKMFITIDPGYSTFKIAIGEKTFFFSSKMLISNNKMSSGFYTVDEGTTGAVTLRFADDDKTTYLFGDSCEVAMDDVDADPEGILSINTAKDRFGDPLFCKSLQAAIAYSAYLYSKEDKSFKIEDISKYNVRFGIVLPNDQVSQYRSKMLSCVTQPFNFKMDIAHEASYDINMDFSKINPKEFGVLSQVISGFYGETMTEDGLPDKDHNVPLPCIVFDGGFRTTGRFIMNRNHEVESSNSVFRNAMFDIDCETARRAVKELQQYEDVISQPFTEKQVQFFVQNGIPLRRGKQKVDVVEIHNQCIQEFAEKAYNDMKQQYQRRMDSVSSILMTGGTGTAYYPYFVEYVKRDYGDNIKVILPSRTFYGEKVDPIFTNVLGLHKFMMNKFK